MNIVQISNEISGLFDVKKTTNNAFYRNLLYKSPFTHGSNDDVLQ